MLWASNSGDLPVFTLLAQRSYGLTLPGFYVGADSPNSGLVLAWQIVSPISKGNDHFISDLQLYIVENTREYGEASYRNGV